MDIKKSHRFPIDRTVSTQNVLEMISNKPRTTYTNSLSISYMYSLLTAAWFGCNGKPKVWKICTRYGRTAINPLIWHVANANIVKTNGRIVDGSSKSWNNFHLETECSHVELWLLRQVSHFLRPWSIYPFIWSNSFPTTWGETHPRSHCKDFRASPSRFRDNNQKGDSGIWKQVRF